MLESLFTGAGDIGTNHTFDFSPIPRLSCALPKYLREYSLTRKYKLLLFFWLYQCVLLPIVYLVLTSRVSDILVWLNSQVVLYSSMRGKPQRWLLYPQSWYIHHYVLQC